MSRSFSTFWKSMDKPLTRSTLCNKHIAGIFVWACSHIFPGSTVQVGRDSQSSGMQALVLEPEDRPTHALFSLNHKTRAMCLSMMSAHYFILPNICIYPKKRIPLCPIRQCARCFWCVSGIPTLMIQMADYRPLYPRQSIALSSSVK